MFSNAAVILICFLSFKVWYAANYAERIGVPIHELTEQDIEGKKNGDHTPAFLLFVLND